MAERIHKYELQKKPDFTLELPRGARILHAEVQKGKPCIWARVKPSAPLEQRRFTFTVTGEDFETGRYIGTFLLQGGSFVAHLFELPATTQP